MEKGGHEVGCCERRESRGWKQMTGCSCNPARNLASGKEALGNSGLHSSDGHSVYAAKLFLYRSCCAFGCLISGFWAIIHYSVYVDALYLCIHMFMFTRSN